MSLSVNGFARCLRAGIAGVYARNPRLANATTGGLTFAAGDLAAQRLEMSRHRSVAEREGQQKDSHQYEQQSYNFRRAAQLGALGFVMNGAFLYTWYTRLDAVIGSSQSSKLGVAAKVAADQFVYAPFSIAVFFYFMSLRQTGSVAAAGAEFGDKMRENFITTYCADCLLWPCSNFVNFRFVQLAYRPTFTAVIQFIWQTYLSYTANAPVHHPAADTDGGVLDTSARGGQ